MSRCTVLLYFVGAVLSLTNANSRVVNITQGPVRGYLDPDGRVYSFYNIPYASAPTGVNRFKAPLPPAVWMHTFDAVDRGIVCPQPGSYVNMQEDCLVANIFIPETNRTSLPVVIQVHGGAYQHRYGNALGLKALVRTNQLIAVTFNYRLGAHGFLCLGTEGAPGNAALKDQVALLRWVNTNIASFGGNPNDVTLMGCSAGGGSVDMLTLSKATTGLFNKAVVASGNAFGAVGIQRESILKAQHYARLLNFNNVEDVAALEDFYRTVPIQVLYSQIDAISGNTDASILFSPCIERDVGEERIFEEAPLEIIREGNYNKIPLLYSFANMEGLIRIMLFETWKGMMNENFADFLPNELHFESDEAKQNVAAIVKQFYFGTQSVSEETILEFIDYFTDSVFAYPMLKGLTARVESLNDTIYLFDYSFTDENTPSLPHTNVKGADHCDQLAAILDEDETGATAEYIRMKTVIREYLINFVLTGVPSAQSLGMPDWPPANADRRPYMSFGNTIELNSSSLLDRRGALWDEIYQHHYRNPEPPQPEPSIASLPVISNVMIACVIVTLYFT